MAAVLDGGTLRALRVQLELPKWNGGAEYSALLGGGHKVAVALPELQQLRFRVAKARALAARGHATVPAARALITQLHRALADAARPTLLHDAPPVGPSRELAGTLRQQLDPPPPADVEVDVRVCGSPPQLFVSAYQLRQPPAADDGSGASVADARHAALPLEDEYVERLEGLGEATALCRALLSKLDAIAELWEADAEAAALQRAAAPAASAVVSAAMGAAEADRLSGNSNLGQIEPEAGGDVEQSPSLRPPRNTSFCDLPRNTSFSSAGAPAAEGA